MLKHHTIERGPHFVNQMRNQLSSDTRSRLCRGKVNVTKEGTVMDTTPTTYTCGGKMASPQLHQLRKEKKGKE